jgi:hypothetical protein
MNVVRGENTASSIEENLSTRPPQPSGSDREEDLVLDVGAAFVADRRRGASEMSNVLCR